MAESKAYRGWGTGMDADEHLQTYGLFVKGARWGVAAMALLLVGMAIFLL